jgi:AmmeMemoRadiSam system protein B
LRGFCYYQLVLKKLLILDLILLFLHILSRFYFQPLVAVLPHHNLVADTRQKFLTQIKSQRPITKSIVIIGPDHFSPYQSKMVYGNQPWNLSSGTLKFADYLETHLNSLLDLDNLLVKNDHSIHNLTTDIKRLWPNASIFPILIGQDVELENLEPLISKLQSVCGFDCLLLASVDFSHYLPAALAHVHDQKSLRVLNNLELDQIGDLEVDSPQSLYLLTKIALHKQAQKFELFSHTNSGFIFHNPDHETTTHVMAFYQRSLFPPYKNDIQTFTYLPYQIDQSPNSTSLGDRFFYGTDKFQARAGLPPNMVLSGFYDSQNVTLYLLPTSIQQGRTYFVKGEEKQNQVFSYLSTIPDLSTYQIDEIWSRITYDRNTNSPSRPSLFP